MAQIGGGIENGSDDCVSRYGGSGDVMIWENAPYGILTGCYLPYLCDKLRCKIGFGFL